MISDALQLHFVGELWVSQTLPAHSALPWVDNLGLLRAF
jgi:hypothetical protein